MNILELADKLAEIDEDYRKLGDKINSLRRKISPEIAQELKRIVEGE